MRHVLLHEPEHRPVEEHHVAEVALLGALALVVDDLGGRRVVDPPARLLDPVAPVEVLPVHEEGLVEQACGLRAWGVRRALWPLASCLLPRKDRVLSHHHARARERVDLADLVEREVRQVVAAEGGALGEELAQARDAVEGDRGRREGAAALGREGAVRVEDAAADCARLGVVVHEGDHRAERVLLEDRVRVEDQHVAPRRLADGLIVGRREAHVLLVCDQPHVREALADHLRRAVRRVVVDDERLDRQPRARLLDRPERLLQELPHVVRHDDDGHVDGVRRGLEAGRGGVHQVQSMRSGAGRLSQRR